MNNVYEYSATIISGLITIYRCGDGFMDIESVNSDDPTFERAKELVLDEQFDEAFDLISRSDANVSLSDNIKYVNGSIYYVYGGTEYPINQVLSDRLISAHLNGNTKIVDTLCNFMTRLLNNPIPSAVDGLYKFLEATNIYIDSDGTFLAYKVVREDFTDKYTGTFDNSIGAKPSMPVHLVDSDGNRTCSNGLHVCSLSYARGFFFNSGDKMVAVRVDPAHVVAVPIDYDHAKMRVSQYEVIGEIDANLDDSGASNALSSYIGETADNMVEGPVDYVDDHKKMAQNIIESMTGPYLSRRDARNFITNNDEMVVDISRTSIRGIDDDRWYTVSKYVDGVEVNHGVINEYIGLYCSNTTQLTLLIIGIDTL